MVVRALWQIPLVQRAYLEFHQAYPCNGVVQWTFDQHIAGLTPELRSLLVLADGEGRPEQNIQVNYIAAVTKKNLCKKYPVSTFPPISSQIGSAVLELKIV